MREASADETEAAAVQDISVVRLLGIGLLTRLVIDTGVQIFFPFLPLIAQGMGLTTVALGRLLSLRSFMGLFAPFFGTMADRRGYRFTMRLSLLLVALGFLTLGFSNNIWLAALGMILIGLGSFSFVPTLQAYLSNRLPYHQRARGIGILEYAWALSGIVGLYVVGLVLDVASWRLPFFAIGVMLLLASFLYGWLPTARINVETASSVPSIRPSWGSRLRNFVALDSNAPSALATIATGSLLMFAAFNLFISYGTWLLNDYGLSASTIGLVALIMGLADLCGSVSVSVVSDRFGKRRSVLTGAVMACLGFWALPLLQATVVTAVIGLILIRSTFEFAIVANMALLSEQVPTQRAKLLTMGAAFSVISTGLAGFTGPWLLQQYGITWLTAVSGIAALLAVIMLLWRVLEPAETAVA